MGPKTKARARGLSPPQMPKTLPRPRKLKLRQRKQRPRLKKLIKAKGLMGPRKKTRLVNGLGPGHGSWPAGWVRV